MKKTLIGCTATATFHCYKTLTDGFIIGKDVLPYASSVCKALIIIPIWIACEIYKVNWQTLICISLPKNPNVKEGHCEILFPY